VPIALGFERVDPNTFEQAFNQGDPFMRERLIGFVIYTCFFLSGASGLIYQIVWMRKLSLVFGNTVHAVSTVVAVFMGGLALGSWLFGRAADSFSKPLKLYVLIELGIAGSGIAISLFLLPVLDNVYIFFHGLGLRTGIALFFVRFMLSVLIILVPTVLMGGTLPVVGRFLVRTRAELGSRIGILYGINTLGAVIGSLATGFWLIALFGELPTVWIAVAGNLAACVLAAALLFSPEKAPTSRAIESKEKTYRPPSYAESRLNLVPWLFAAAGFASLAYEVLWTRALVYFVGLSVHAFTIILTCFLAGIALGSLAVTRFVDKWNRLFLLFGLLQWIIAASALASIPLFGELSGLYQRLNLLLGVHTWNLAMVVKFLLCLVILGLPTLAMGAAFPIVNRLFVRRRSQLGRGVGALYAANTTGTILGSLCAGFILLPLAGITGSILLVAVINAAVSVIAIMSESETVRVKNYLAPAGLVLLFAGGLMVYASGGLGPIVRYSLKNAGKEILYCRESTEASIAVLRNTEGYRELNINGESTAYTGFEDIVIHKLLAHLPILFHPNPKSILVVGFGFGSTLYTATTYGFPEVECVELVPDEVATAKYFLPENHGVLSRPGVRMIFEDGRNLILTSSGKYDIISFNAIHPRLSPMLYTLDFYRLCARALAPGGTICAWLPTNGMTLEEFKSLLRTFIEVFPHSSLWWCNPANLILLGGSEPFEINYPAFRRSLAAEKVRENLREIRLESPLALASLFIMGEERLRGLTLDAPLNTDAEPIIEFSRTMKLLVPLETYNWLMDNLEPVTEHLAWRDGPASADSLAELRRRARQWYEARRIFYRGKFAGWVYKEYSSATAMYRKALMLNPEDDYIRYFLENRALDPDSLEALASADASDYIVRYQLGEYYYNRGAPAKAGRWFREVVRIRPDHAQAWFQLGLCAEGQGKPAEAERCFLKAHEINPASPQALINLGLIYYRRQDYTQARKYFEKALHASPEDSDALFNLGNLELRLGREKEAEKLFRQAINNNPFHSRAYLNLGALLTTRGDYEKALESYREAIELSPGLMPAYYNLAITYEKMGDTQNAEKYRAIARRLEARMSKTPE